MYHADNDFGYEPTSEDLQDWQDSESTEEEDCFSTYIVEYKYGAGRVQAKTLKEAWRKAEDMYPHVGDVWEYIPESVPEPYPDPFVSLTKEGPFWSPVYVFTRKSGRRLELNSKEYAKLVNSQR